ncbi:MAG: class I SAM-dependent methyltransferase [Saprospiraceae bacterium]|nr:class I SAM-dependent methyltransferase [Lewinella sp.]
MKDNFSTQSEAYAKFRPVYPPALYEAIYQWVNGFERAWDCATGNGQVARALAKRFKDVQATDISRQQLEKAEPADNIVYSVQPAETADFPAGHFDLITVGQAIHWFDHQRWYEKVVYCLRPDGILAEFGYPLFRMDETINPIIDRFYHDIVGPYWDTERRHLDDAFARIPFPLERLATPQLNMDYQWTFEQTLGYFSSWSSVQHYKRKHGSDPVELIRAELERAWLGSEQKRKKDLADMNTKKTASFHILLRIGRLNS